MILFGIEIIAIAFVLAWQTRLVAALAQQGARLAKRVHEHELRLDMLEAEIDARLEAERLGDVFGDE